MVTRVLFISTFLALYCSVSFGQELDHGDENREGDHDHTEVHNDDDIEHEHVHGHPRHAFALLGVYAAGFPRGESVIHHGGVGLAYHTGLIPEKLELEVAVKAVFAEEHKHFPLELALKIPFSLGDRTFLSIGLGPVVALDIHDDEIGVAFGGGTGVELSHWYKPWGGFVVAVAYELLYHEDWINKVVVVAGPAFGF